MSDLQSVQDNWDVTKAKIKRRWNKFTDSDVDGFKDDMNKITAQIQKTYGVAKELAEKEYYEFKANLHSKKADWIGRDTQQDDKKSRAV